MKFIQLSLFGDISSKKTMTVNEMKLEGLLEKLRKYIKDGVINTSDTYFNIAYHREAKIVKTNNVYCLYFAQASDSERLLSAYEAKNDITPEELLKLSLPNGVIKSLSLYIKNNPNADVKEIFDNFRIWEYPSYNWIHAQATSMATIEIVKDLIIEWVLLKEEMKPDLSEGRFTFMRTNKRAKEADQTTVLPQCFDGLCLENHFMKEISKQQIA